MSNIQQIATLIQFEKNGVPRQQKTPNNVLLAPTCLMGTYGLLQISLAFYTAFT